MNFIKSFTFLLLIGWGLNAYGQTFTHEGKIEDKFLYTGKHTWRNEAGIQVAEVIFDDKGNLLSFMTWYKGEIMDAVKVDPKRDIRTLPNFEWDEIEWLENGLGIKRETKGNGEGAKDGQKVYVNYQGLLQDGTQFDNSFERNKPFKFTLGKRQVIEGFEQAIKMMTVGEMVWIYVPDHLGYGTRSIGSIPPFANLWYKLELVGIK